jgi:hypothetical protein
LPGAAFNPGGSQTNYPGHPGVADLVRQGGRFAPRRRPIYSEKRNEQETIINFNKAEDVAHIFTYEKTWQQHLEKRLGLKPTMDNGFGGKAYEIPKKRIRPPRAPVRLSAEARAKLSKRMKDMSQKRSLPSKTTVATVKSDKRNQSKGKTITQQPRLLGE